eukprot:13755942-Ditylum_brightwellii.AAC.1
MPLDNLNKLPLTSLFVPAQKWFSCPTPTSVKNEYKGAIHIGPDRDFPSFDWPAFIGPFGT